MVAQDLLQMIAIGAIGGVFGQGLRVVVGVKKASDEASVEGKSLREEGLDVSRMVFSLFIGAIAGGVGIFTITGFSAVKDITVQMFFGIVGMGYAGTDFIEGFIRTQFPKPPAPALAPVSFELRSPVSGALAAGLTLSNADRIKQTCDRLLQLPAHAGDCSGFLKAVATEFGVSLTGQANDIVDQLTAGNGWTELGSDAQAGVKAAEAAARGEFVVGARKENGNGHVVVVVQGTPLAHGKYPFAYWGKLKDPANAGFNKTVNWAWNQTTRDSVTYASRPLL